MGRHLEEAAALGDRLAGAALWHGDRCNWFGRAKGTGTRDGLPAARPMEPSFYSGTAGIAWFLAHLADKTGEPRHRATAEGAARHALRHARALDPTAASDDLARRDLGGRLRGGYYIGSLGVAWVGWTLGTRWGQQDLRRGALAVLEGLDLDGPAPFEDDLVFGSAGAIPALLQMEDQGCPGAGALAHRLALRVARAAGRREDGAWTWTPPHWNSGSEPLTGWSHGASGFAWGLACAWSAFKDEEFRAGALGALAYERSVYDAQANVWPDFQLREEDGSPGRRRTWCHGAPGIGLARVLVGRLIDARELREEARLARRATLEELQERLPVPGLDFAPCCGLAGLAEVLWLLDEALGLDGGHGRARAVADWGIARFGREARAASAGIADWPTAAAAGFHPSLLTGLAGIGHFLLRLEDPARVPTVLAPGPATGPAP